MVNRRVRSHELKESGAIINWFSAIEGLTWTDIKYTTDNGETNMVRLNPGDERIICPDFKEGTGFQFSSSFIPEEFSIDTFSVDWEQYEGIYKYDRSTWSVLAVSDETASDGGGMNTLLDDNLGSYWHSKWDGGEWKRGG